MRIALFGGTFDPPHRGHMAIARAAAVAFHLDRVLFAPTGLQPLKLDATPTSFADRLAMVAAVCAEANQAIGTQLFLPTDLDRPHPDHTPNYTVDTLSALHDLHPDDELFSLAGADSFLTLPRWRSPNRLLELAQWIVVTRPGYEITEAQLATLDLTLQQRARVHLLTDIHEDVSATSLRERLRQGDPCTDLLSPAISACIAERHLYQPA